MNISFESFACDSGVDVASSPKAKGEWRAMEEWCVVEEKELKNPECEYSGATQTCGATCGNVDENSHPRKVSREY